ncbi:MAG TPA: hypothetical protein VMI10_01960 [Terriglobales bacterium]|nr:hypothetical protein [Terriglobales bacterium]
MSDDARISCALPRHPKLIKLERRLGAQGCWSLVKLFLWVSENRPDGSLEGLTDEDIEIAAGWNGDNGAFVGPLSEVRFIDGESGSYRVHDWAEHNPWAAHRLERIESGRRAAAARWEKHDKNPSHMRSACDSDADRMRVACTTHDSAMPASPLLSSPPNSKRGRGKNGHAPPSPYSQSDFDERDLRLIGKAERDLAEKLKGRVGAEPITEQEYYIAIAEHSGLTVGRVLELKETQRKWPVASASA